MTASKVNDAVGMNSGHPHHNQGRKRVPTRSLQSASSLTEMSAVSVGGYCDTAPTEWRLLPTFACFSLSPDGSFLKVKDSRSSYIDLKTGGHETGIATGRCYRVYVG